MSELEGQDPDQDASETSPGVPRETVPAGPPAIAYGRFKLFATEAGGLHLVYSIESDNAPAEERHFEVSPVMMKMMRRGPWGKMFNAH